MIYFNCLIYSLFSLSSEPYFHPGVNIGTVLTLLKPISVTFFYLLMLNFLVFLVKLGHFIGNTIVFKCSEHSSLTAKIWKGVKTKFCRIASWSQYQKTVFLYCIFIHFIKLGRSLACTIFVMIVAVKLNRENQKTSKNKVC